MAAEVTTATEVVTAEVTTAREVAECGEVEADVATEVAAAGEVEAECGKTATEVARVSEVAAYGDGAAEATMARQVAECGVEAAAAEEKGAEEVAECAQAAAEVTMAGEVTEGGAVAAAEVTKVGEEAACGEMQDLRAQAQNGGASLGSQQAHGGYAIGTPISSLPSSKPDDREQPVACALVMYPRRLEASMAPKKRTRPLRPHEAAALKAAALFLSGGQVWPEGIAVQREEGLFCDAEVNVDGAHFLAHRCVLAAGSSFFKGLYTGGIPLKEGPYSLEQVSADTFAAVLAWLYEGSCKLATQDGLVPLLEAADLLGVLPLRDAVATAIIKRLTPDSCIGAWDLASRHSLPPLADAARSVCLESFDALQASGTLDALSATRLGELLSDDKLAVKDESVVFAAMKRWLAAQETEPAEAVVASLLRHIRFEQMDEAERSRIADEPLMQKLALMKVMAKTAGGARPARMGNIPSGVQLALPGTFLDGSWTLHYDADYGHVTKRAELAVPSSAKWVFVGARSPEGTITIGAVGARDEVLKDTPINRPHEHNGVAWYLTENKSFGFAPAGCEVAQDHADALDSQGEFRLSWHLDGADGYRAGDIIPDGDDDPDEGSRWRKLLYYK